MRNLRSNEVTGPIPADIGVGLEFDGVTFKEHWGRAVTCLPSHSTRGGKRTVTLQLSSFAGISAGAVHTYAQLIWGGCSYRKLGEEKTDCQTYPNGMPDISESTEIAIARPVTRKDVRRAKDNEDSWIPRIGDYTIGFWTEDEAREYAVRWFKDHFGPGWVLLTLNEEGDRVVVCES